MVTVFIFEFERFLSSRLIFIEKNNFLFVTSIGVLVLCYADTFSRIKPKGDHPSINIPSTLTAQTDSKQGGFNAVAPNLYLIKIKRETIET